MDELNTPIKTPGVLSYALAIFASAFLLFQVQPLIAKMILPWFGGSAGVWTICMLFFQIVLLLGYLYAHLSVKYLAPRLQALLHMGLLLASLVFLPVIPNATWKPTGGGNPDLGILAVLAMTVGLPYFLLSTTSPMLQAWYTRTRKGAVPYRLFALSNAGSMLALLSYPILVEPNLATRYQALGWSGGYAVFAVLGALLGLGTLRRARIPDAEDEREAAAARPGWPVHLLWLALAACASALLLAVTNELTQNIASIPFLWIVPLALYLLSFIICFESPRWYNRYVFIPLLAAALGGMAYGLNGQHDHPELYLLIPLYAGGLFVCSMACHGELARLKPHPRYLTSFYLMISLGGATGGMLVGLLAPHVLNGYYELQIAMACCAFLILLAVKLDPSSWLFRSRLLTAAAYLVALGLTGYLSYSIRESTRDALLRVRNFYGVLQVRDYGEEPEEFLIRELTHGTISHGEQFRDPARRTEPITYYGPQSGVALALRAERRLPHLQGVRVGVIGLGTGTIAAYGRVGDTFRFYDINPLVLRIANSEFTYLKDSKAKIEIALGDARLSLEREPKQEFDLLAVDAFSSDSIPIHLLTREAFALYFHHLKDNGVLAVHISNRYLELAPVVQLVANSVGKKAQFIENSDDDDAAVFNSKWVLVPARQEFFNHPDIEAVAQAIESKPGVRLWTDDYSNLYRVLK